ncbi:MAG: cupin domain-containing protein [Candidatus Nanosyncoccaceae bacterium]|jgi:hypothetical protein
MKVWRDKDGEEFRNSKTCWGREYKPDTCKIDVSKISVRGKFPESGWGYNEEAHEVAVVVAGKGSIEKQGGEKKELAMGDVIHFAPMERVRWEGDLDLIIACGPAFDRNKHHIEEDL